MTLPYFIPAIVDFAESSRLEGRLQIANVELPIGFRGIQTANLVGWTGDVNHPEYRKLVRAIETGEASIEAADAALTEIARVRAGNGFKADLHEILAALADTRRSGRPAPSSHHVPSRRGRRMSP